MIPSWVRRLAGSRLTPSQRRNAEYDRDTVRIIKTLPPNATCIDVGAAAGSVLRAMVRAVPDGRHFAFEPRPDAAQGLRRSFPGVEIQEVALSDRAGAAPFQLVVDSPMWSGLRVQTYPQPDARINQITVRTDRLDDVLSADLRVDFIKIDVEGAEALVLRGAERTCRRWAPLIVVEYGLAAREHYGVSPTDFFGLISGLGLDISLLQDWLRGRPPLDIRGFDQQCQSHWYFIAHPGRSDPATGTPVSDNA